MKLGIVFKKDNGKAQEIAGEVEKYLANKGVEVLGEDNLKGADYIITSGGDGTLIHKACELASQGVPLVGINTGNLGFLTAADSTEWKGAVDKILDGKVTVSERMTLDIVVEPEAHLRGARMGSKAHLGGEVHRAINEAVIKGVYRVVDMKVLTNEQEFLRVTGDGVIVATQTGSTAYSLSAGGAIVDPELNCLLVTPINPIGLPIPPIVLSASDEIVVELVKGDDVSLIIDGQEHEKLLMGQSVKVSKGQYSVKFGYFDKHQFLKSLNAKFGLADRSVGQ